MADPPEFFDIPLASDVVRDAAKAVVRLEHPAGGAGTGSFISKGGLLLTNSHILGAETCSLDGCWVSLSFGRQLGTLSLPPRRLFVVPRHVDAGLDMAVVQVFKDDSRSERLSTPHFLALAKKRASDLVGEHLTAIGHPLGALKKWSEGVVVRADGEWFESTIFSLPGGSGSPIIDDEGRLVGLLHRGATGLELLTPTSTQVSAIATASAPLERAMGDKLPVQVISLSEPMTREAALAHSDAFLAAETAVANIDGEQVSLVAVFGAMCEESLARDDYGSIEELEQALLPCFSALGFIECRSDLGEKGSFKQCPSGASETWLARMDAVSRKGRTFNGSLDLSSISYAVEALGSNFQNGEQIARRNLLAVLDDEGPVLDFPLASFLVAYDIDTYDDQRLRDYIVGYAGAPFYERFAWEITQAAVWLYYAGELTRQEALEIAHGLYHDDGVSLGARLRIEEVLYESDEI